MSKDCPYHKILGNEDYCLIDKFDDKINIYVPEKVEGDCLEDYIKCGKYQEKLKEDTDFKLDRRLSWDEYFMLLTFIVSTRATCDRKKVGALIVKDRTILSTGYNGSIKGLPHCDDVGHLMENGHCVRTVHAEINAITQAAKYGININHSTIYVNTHPCWNCFKAIVNSGIERIVYSSDYRKDPKIYDSLKMLKGFKIEKLEMDKENILSLLDILLE